MNLEELSMAAALVGGSFILADDPPANTVPGGLTPTPYVILCGTADRISEFLRGNGETVAARGITAKSGGPGLVAQFWVNPKTHDWTLVYVDPSSGIACMVAAGTEFGVDRAPPGAPRPGSI